MLTTSYYGTIQDGITLHQHFLYFRKVPLHKCLL